SRSFGLRRDFREELGHGLLEGTPDRDALFDGRVRLALEALRTGSAPARAEAAGHSASQRGPLFERAQCRPHAGLDVARLFRQERLDGEPVTGSAAIPRQAGFIGFPEAAAALRAREARRHAVQWAVARTAVDLDERFLFEHPVGGHLR